jgi:branched-chain amino acid aminotransferase
VIGILIYVIFAVCLLAYKVTSILIKKNNNSEYMNIETIKSEVSRATPIDPKDIKFGKVYSDHMLVADYNDGAWGKAYIGPFENLSLSPATSFMHYGQAIFEGIKAYKSINGDINIFRPLDNWKRFNKSAHRMAMPHVPENIFMEGMRQLIELDKDWVPTTDGCSLYLRPFMMGTDEFIGVKPAEEFKFLVITSPAGAYYAAPIKLYVHDKYVRAAPGGVGFAKAAGNYGATMQPMVEVRELGYDQILWTDSVEHRYVQECGTMNAFFVIGDTVITPDLSEGTILEGVTRDSIIQLLKDRNIKVEERPLSMDEICAAYDAGELKEVFGAGTAAVIAPVAELFYEGKTMTLPSADDKSITETIKKELADIRYGRIPDRHNWMFKVC